MNPNNYCISTPRWMTIVKGDVRLGDRVKLTMVNDDEHTITVAVVDESAFYDTAGREYRLKATETIQLDTESRPKLPRDVGRIIRDITVIGQHQYDYGIRVDIPGSTYSWKLFNVDSEYTASFSDHQIHKFKLNG